MGKNVCLLKESYETHNYTMWAKVSIVGFNEDGTNSYHCD
jgi:hypothetical protein